MDRRTFFRPWLRSRCGHDRHDGESGRGDQGDDTGSSELRFPYAAKRMDRTSSIWGDDDEDWRHRRRWHGDDNDDDEDDDH